MTSKSKLQTKNLSQSKVTHRMYMQYSLKLLRLTISKLQGKICEKCLIRVTRVGVYGPHTQVKCLLKA